MRGQRIRYSAEELAFVRRRHAQPHADIHAAFVARFGRSDVTVMHITALCKRNGWHTQREPWSTDDDTTIRAQYADTPTAVIAKALGRTTEAVYRRAVCLGLKKSRAYLASNLSGRLRRGDPRGAETRFAPGHTSHNKGKKRPGWAAGRMRETQFAPGMATWNTVPVGSTRVKDGYEWTKVADAPRVLWTENWRQTHLVRWEAVHGALPAGHVLKCLDGNRLNTDPANWLSVPRGVLARLNGGPQKKRIGFDQAPVELKPTVLAVAQLEHALGRRKRRTQEAPCV